MRVSWLSTAENFALFSAMLAVNLAPGPNMLFAFASGVAGGRNAGVLAALGAALGLVVHALTATAVTVTLFRLEPGVLNALRWIGAGYLVWLGIRAIRSTASGPGPARSRVPSGGVFLRGAMTSLTNPKPALFFAAFLPQFVTPAAGSVALQMLALGAIFTASATAVNSTVGWTGGILEDVLRRRPRFVQWPTRVAGVAMLCLGSGLLIEAVRA
jgi:threonine/homoserine/homoserine lactone efflux protein